MRILRVIGIKGTAYEAEAVKAFFQDFENAMEGETGDKPTMLSATCGDIFGCFTLLVGLPEGMAEEVSDKIGHSLAIALIGRYDYVNDATYDTKVGQWIMTATGKESVVLN